MGVTMLELIVATSFNNWLGDGTFCPRQQPSQFGAQRLIRHTRNGVQKATLENTVPQCDIESHAIMGLFQ